MGTLYRILCVLTISTLMSGSALVAQAQQDDQYNDQSPAADQQYNSPNDTQAPVDPQDQHAVLQRPVGVADDGEVLEVGLRLVEEPLPLGPGHRRERALLDGGGPVAEPPDHRVDVERVSHPRGG